MGGYKEKLCLNPVLVPPVQEQCLVDLKKCRAGVTWKNDDGFS